MLPREAGDGVDNAILDGRGFFLLLPTLQGCAQGGRERAAASAGYLLLRSAAGVRHLSSDVEQTFVDRAHHTERRVHQVADAQPAGLGNKLMRVMH